MVNKLYTLKEVVEHGIKMQKLGEKRGYARGYRSGQKKHLKDFKKAMEIKCVKIGNGSRSHSSPR